MLNQENKIITIGLFLVFFLTECLNKEQELKEKRQLYYSMGLNAAGEEYNQVYKLAQDSLKNWTVHNLSSYEYERLNSWKLDSLLCFNKNVDRCIMAILVQSVSSIDVQDGIDYLYGVKIKERWYFFQGAAIALPREYYQKDIHTPLSFEKLHEIAMKEVFRGYLTKNEQEKWEINDDFFKGMENKNRTGGGYGGCLTCKSFEEYVLHLIKRNWQRRDTTYYAPGD